MRTLILASLLAGAAAAVAGCSTVPPPAPAGAVVAANGVCAASAPIDVNGDGWISGDEWNTFHTSTYANWDLNHDGRVSRSEFEACYQAGGFYPANYYNPSYWTNYWTAFDANGDGYLTADEYWSPTLYARIDRNHNGRIDADEWLWWTGG